MTDGIQVYEGDGVEPWTPRCGWEAIRELKRLIRSSFDEHDFQSGQVIAMLNRITAQTAPWGDMERAVDTIHRLMASFGDDRIRHVIADGVRAIEALSRMEFGR